MSAKCINECPIGQNVSSYISLAGAGRYEEAISVIYQTNTMPVVCGRVCTHPCVGACLRAQTPHGSEGGCYRGRRGRLAAACRLAMMGYRPTVFDGLPKLGGMVRYGTPA